MWHRFLIWLDKRHWPQRFVAWASRRRARSRLAGYFFPVSSATQAVTLSVASPLLSARDLFEAIVPQTFGSWHEYRVCRSVVYDQVAVAVLKEQRSGTVFSLVTPVHAGFPRLRFLSARRLRLACEAERARLVTVRLQDGRLLAAGTLELVPTAAYSRPVREGAAT